MGLAALEIQLKLAGYNPQTFNPGF